MVLTPRPLLLPFFTHNTNVQCRSPDGLALLPIFFYVRMSGPFNAVGISILSYFSPTFNFFFFRNLSTKNIFKKSLIFCSIDVKFCTLVVVVHFFGARVILSIVEESRRVSHICDDQIDHHFSHS